MIKVRVDRRKWYRGKGSMESRLLKPNGMMCCIGFLAKAIGCTNRQILKRSTLEDTPGELAGAFCSEHMGLLNDAYEINDNRDMDDSVRETKLKELGKDNGVAFTFVTPRKTAKK